MGEPSSINEVYSTNHLSSRSITLGGFTILTNFTQLLQVGRPLIEAQTTIMYKILYIEYAKFHNMTYQI